TSSASCSCRCPTKLSQTCDSPTLSLSRHRPYSTLLSFFFNDPATTEIYTLSLHDALPIFRYVNGALFSAHSSKHAIAPAKNHGRSEEHTSELQSRENLVCRLLLEKKKI